MGKVRGGASRAEFWREVLARQQRSGLSVRRFCRDGSLSEPSFYWWRRELAQGRRTDVSRKKRTASARFVNVSLLADAAIIELELADGRRLRIPPGCDESTLATVLRVLESP